VGPLILFGGWLLMHNPEAHNPNAPLSAWKEVRSYDTAYLCEQARHKEAVEAAGDDHSAPSGMHELRYRCVREEHVHPPAH